MKVVLAYLVIALTVIGNVVHTLTTDPNAATLLTPTVKAVLVAVASLVALFLPAIQSLSNAAKSKAAEVVKSGGAGLGVLMLALVLGGCAWFKSNQQALEPVEADTCVFGATEAGMPPEAAAAFCHVAVDYVNSLLAKKATAKSKALAATRGDAGSSS